MSNRRPADPPYTGRPTGALARSPSEQLEPTRPLARSKRRYRYAREPGRSSGLFRLVSGVFTVLLLLMAIVGGVVYAFLPAPVEADLVEIKRGTLRVTVDEDGKTRIREKYVVSAPLNGRILRISMDPGDVVVAGKTLLTMIEPRDPELLDARSVAQAEARVKAAEAERLHKDGKHAESEKAAKEGLAKLGM